MSIVVKELAGRDQQTFKVDFRSFDLLTVVEEMPVYIVSAPVLAQVAWVRPLLDWLGCATVVEDRDIPGGMHEGMVYFLAPALWPTFHPDAGPREVPGAPGVFVRSCWVGGCELTIDKVLQGRSEVRAEGMGG